MPNDFLSSEEDRNRLGHFLKRRQLNDRIVELLKGAKEAHDLKRGEITTAQNASYDNLTESLAKAISHGWISREELTSVLHDGETAGRQHICVFSVPEDSRETVEAMLRSPRTLNTEEPQLSDFWTIPLEPYSRILLDDKNTLMVKTVAPRDYWVVSEERPSEDLIEITKEREKERSAIIFKYTPANGFLQCRVPTREKKPGADTSKSVYEFLAEIASSEFASEGDSGAQSLLGLVDRFELGNSFQKIIENREDFELHKDTPENQDLKTSMAHRASADDAKDIRDYDEWVYEKGFARTSIKGKWKRGEDAILVHMHDESVKLGKQLSRHVSRLFFPRPCTDADIEHVITRIKDHI